MKRSYGAQLLYEIGQFIKTRPELQEELRASMVWAFVESFKNKEPLYQTALAMVRDGLLDPRDIARARHTSSKEVEFAQAKISSLLEDWDRVLPCDVPRFIQPPRPLVITSIEELAGALAFFAGPND